jgi:transcriptional regulator with XRE-family HTH domain
MKTAERELARALRREHGVSVKKLARIVGVSRSSISLWVRDIELTPTQQAALRRAGAAGGAASRSRALARKRAAQEEGRDAARRGDRLHMAGCMLFWAEGSRARNAVQFTNSDPRMAVFFLRFLRVCFGVPDTKVRVCCNLFADHVERQQDIERYWLDVLELPRTCLTKTMVNKYSKHSLKKRRNKLPYGTCRLTVHDTLLAQHLYGAIQEYGGFECAAWLF